jgi:hypothetical protein
MSEVNVFEIRVTNWQGICDFNSLHNFSRQTIAVLFLNFYAAGNIVLGQVHKYERKSDRYGLGCL